MSPRPWPQRVRDIIDAIDEIAEFTRGMTFEQFAADQKTIKAVLADFSIIGEAARHVPREVTDAHLSIPWQSMRDVRNIVVHAYFGVSERIIWDTLTNHLPQLRRQLWLLIESPLP